MHNFDGEVKVSTGKQQKQGGKSLQTQNLAGKRVFLAGHPSTLAGRCFSAGQCFSGVVTGGGGVWSSILSNAGESAVQFKLTFINRLYFAAFTEETNIINGDAS